MTPQQHIAWFLVPAWGHITSGNATICRLLQLNPSLVITVLHHNMIRSKAEADLYRYPDIPKDRLHIVGVGKDEIRQPFAEAFAQVMKDYSEGWLDLLSKLCSPGQQEWPKPTTLILDQFGGNLTLPAAKNIVGPSCKTLMHWTGSVSSFYSFLLPSEQSGFSDYESIVNKYYDDEALRKGRERAEILEEVCKAKNGSDSLNGTVVKVPGVIDMYDYEREASNSPTPPGVAPMLAEMVNLAKNTDGIVITSSETLESAAIAACHKAATMYPVGVQIAPRGWETGLRVDDDELRSFLDKNPEKSVLYISFGSHFFPTTDPSHFLALVETLFEIDFPFILGLGSHLAMDSVSNETIERITRSGKGIIVKSWVDQQAVLQHPSLGWFLTHGGWNSISESLAQGVPMMMWPLAQSDQAVNAALMSTREKPVAFEFMQIRQGPARAPSLRGGDPVVGDLDSVKKEFKDVFRKARGQEGEKLRANAKVVAMELKAERDSRGDEVIKQLALL